MDLDAAVLLLGDSADCLRFVRAFVDREVEGEPVEVTTEVLNGIGVALAQAESLLREAITLVGEVKEPPGGGRRVV